MSNGHPMNVERWKPGDPVLYQSMIMAQPLVTITVTVVADDPDLLVLYRPHGAPYTVLVNDDGSPLPRVMPPDTVRALGGRRVGGVWPHGPTLLLTPKGAAHAILLNWSLDWVFERWYVNLQQQTIRTRDGFQATDQFLDIIVQPDRSWAWKDEDELEEAIAVGRLTADDARDIRREGDRVVANVIARRSPFDGTCQHWRPDPSWPMPTLPNSPPQR